MRRAGNRGAALIPLAIMNLTSGTTLAADASRAPAGTLKERTAVKAITLSNDHGFSAKILTDGAALQSLIAPDKAGKSVDASIGYDNLSPFFDHPNYSGVAVGLYANRIAGGAFTLGGRKYQLPLNDRSNSLHGGGKSFDKSVGRVVSMKSGPTASLTLSNSVLVYRLSARDFQA